jgi:hypothetical protein
MHVHIPLIQKLNEVKKIVRVTVFQALFLIGIFYIVKIAYVIRAIKKRKFGALSN